MFGEDDPDQDVSPDTEDPEAKVDGENSVTDTGNVKRVSTRQWIQEIDYDPEKLFDKFFLDDIKYLLSMGMSTNTVCTEWTTMNCSNCSHKLP